MPADSQPKSPTNTHVQKEAAKDKVDKKSISINLSGKPKESTGNLFYKWAVNIGRIVIVLTELVALSALFYRFVIDRQIADINDQITTQVSLIRSNEEREKEFRAVQDKLEVIDAINKDTKGKLEIMNAILSTAESGVFSANNLSVNKNIISVDGVASSIFAINSFVEELKTNEDVNSISIGDITSTDSGITFMLQITLAGLPEDEVINVAQEETAL